MRSCWRGSALAGALRRAARLGRATRRLSGLGQARLDGHSGQGLFSLRCASGVPSKRARISKPVAGTHAQDAGRLAHLSGSADQVVVDQQRAGRCGAPAGPGVRKQGLNGGTCGWLFDSGVFVGSARSASCGSLVMSTGSAISSLEWEKNVIETSLWARPGHGECGRPRGLHDRGMRGKDERAGRNCRPSA